MWHSVPNGKRQNTFQEGRNELYWSFLKNRCSLEGPNSFAMCASLFVGRFWQYPSIKLFNTMKQCRGEWLWSSESGVQLELFKPAASGLLGDTEAWWKSDEECYGTTPWRTPQKLLVLLSFVRLKLLTSHAKAVPLVVHWWQRTRR